MSEELYGYIGGTRKNDNGMIYRMLGRTGVEVSAIGLGGAHISKVKTEDEAIKIIRSAIDGGITFLDNSWDYHEGESERRMGLALQDGYRENVFLMSKIDARTKDDAERQINESLKRLRTDYVDLMQFHEVIRMEDPDRIFAEEGAIQGMLAAQKAGKVRYIGFTGHKDPMVHIRMLDLAARHGFRFDTVQMPLNVMDAHFRSFEHMVLPILVRERIGVIGMKCMGDGIILESRAVTPIECLYYALNLPISVVVTGIDSMGILDQAFRASRSFVPLRPEEVERILASTKPAAMDGRYEKYKTDVIFDGTAMHPEWLGYHMQD